MDTKVLGVRASLESRARSGWQRIVLASLISSARPLFAEENEWRAIDVMKKADTPSRVRFKAAGNKLNPYVALEFSKFQSGSTIPIRRVFHGPTLNPDLSVRALKLLLSKYGYSDAEVTGSRIPLRI